MKMVNLKEKQRDWKKSIMPFSENNKSDNVLLSWSKRPKKVLLWLAALLQLLIIGGFWLLQIMHNYQAPLVVDVIQTETLHISTNSLQQQQSRVNFIKKGANNFNLPDKRYEKATHFKNKYNVNSFKEDFKQLTNIMDNNNKNNITWCFIAGTQQQEQYTIDDEFPCSCQPEWHGRDCSQPEAIWRALMTSRRHSLKLRTQPAKEPKRLIYIIQGNFLNLLLLELQIEAVQNVVDYFIIYYNNIINNDKNNKVKFENNNVKLLKKHLQNIFGTNRNYMLLQCQQHKNCHNYNFKFNPTDACLISDDHTILSMHALKFYKYYAHNYDGSSNEYNSTENSEVWRFRLKHNVYGFFWQHPQKTQLAGILTSCATFNKNYNNNNNNFDNFNLISKRMSTTVKQFIVGDLNHFGGWYCEYCQQPEEIITELLLEAEIGNNNNHNNNKRTKFVLLHSHSNKKVNNDIHAADLQSFISHGIYVDGKLQLIKMRRYVDKYFAPSIALNNTMGKYSNFLLNMYESLDDDLFDDDYINGL